MKIALQPWEYHCSDGCCSEYGTKVYIDDELVTEYGNQDHVLLRSVLEHLGYTLEIVGLDEAGEETWRA